MAKKKMGLKEFLKIMFNISQSKTRSKTNLVKDKKIIGNELTKALTKVKRLEKQINTSKTTIKITNLDEKEQFYNNKFKQSTIIYNARNSKQYDVREFISVPNALLSNLRETKVYPKDFNDLKALKILQWMLSNFKYKLDEGEYWQFPTDTLHKRTGDCEDFTHLYVSILINLGIPAYRIKVCCGWAIHPKTKQKYGHSYPIYLREFDDKWVPMDLTFLPNTLPVVKRTEHKLDKNYGELWFLFNNEYSWSNKEIETEGRIRDEEIRD